MMKCYFALILLISILIGCASNPHLSADPNMFYRRDIIIKDERTNRWCKGVCVWPQAKKYEFKLYVDRGDYGIIETCSGELSFSKVGSQYEWSYSPDEKLAYNSPSCPMRIRTYDFKKEMHQWAYVDFEQREIFKLPALSRCNNTVRDYYGVGICQNKLTLRGSLEFKVDTQLVPSSECSSDKVQFLKEENSYRIVILKPGVHKCMFIENQEPFRKFKYTIIGYEQILIPRGDNQ